MLSASSVHVHIRIHVSNLILLALSPALSPSTVSGVNKPPWNMQQAFWAAEQKMIYVDANKKPTTNNNNNIKNNNRRSS